MNKRKVFCPILIIWIFFLFNDLNGQNADIKFTHFYVDPHSEPSSWGTGGFTVDDFDKDGDQDLTIQREETGKVFWYQNDGSESWQ